jgi:hypothetical protein
MDPDIKMQYKDPTFIESIRGNVPMTVVNGVIQTVKKTSVSSSTLTLASEKKSITFVRRWAKETIDRVSLLLLVIFLLCATFSNPTSTLFSHKDERDSSLP